MASVGSQLEGCRLKTVGQLVTTGAAGGGRLTKRKTDREAEIGGEIDYARANFLGGKGTRVNIVVGERGTRSIT